MHAWRRPAKASMLAVTAALVLITTAVPSQAQPPSTDDAQHVTFNAVYVVNGGDGENGSVTVINADTNTVARTIALPGAMWPHHVYLSPGRGRLAVAVPGMDMSGGHGGTPPQGRTGEVILLDAVTGTILNQAMTPAMNHNAVFSADGSQLWTSQMMMPGTVMVLDSQTLLPKAEIAVGDMPTGVTRTPDGRFFYVANSMSGTVNVIDATSQKVVKTIPVGDTPVGAWQANNGFAYVDNEVSMTVSAINRATMTVTATFDLGFMPGMAMLGPDGHLWVTDADNGQVVLYSLDTVRRHIIVTGAGAHGITFSTNARAAYITNQMAGTVSVVDMTARRVVKTLTVGVKPNGLVYRPAN